MAERRDVHHLHALGRAGHRPRHRRRVRQAGRGRVWTHHHPRRAGHVRRVARRPFRAPAGGARPARVAGGAAGERRQAVRVFLARHHHHQVLVLDRPLHGREGGDQAPAGWRERPHDRVVRRRVAGPELLSAPAGGPPPPLDLEHRRASLVGGGGDGGVSRPAAVRLSRRVTAERRSHVLERAAVRPRHPRRAAVRKRPDPDAIRASAARTRPGDAVASARRGGLEPGAMVGRYHRCSRAGGHAWRALLWRVLAPRCSRQRGGSSRTADARPAIVRRRRVGCDTLNGDPVTLVPGACVRTSGGTVLGSWRPSRGVRGAAVTATSWGG